MTGLNKIIDQIGTEAKVSADQIIKEAEQTAGEILDKARLDSEAQIKSIEDKSRHDLKNYQERVRSSADFQRRTALLKAKQELITEMIEKAYHALDAKADGEYFEFIAQVIRRSVLPKEGEIYFSQRDLSRLPRGFEQVINEAAISNGGSLTLAKEPKEIDNGFILVYGGIEENCTFRALFDAKKEQLQDKANAVVFL